MLMPNFRLYNTLQVVISAFIKIIYQNNLARLYASKYSLTLIISFYNQLCYLVKSCLTNKKKYLQSNNIAEIEYTLYTYYINLGYLALLLIYYFKTGELE